MQRCQMLQYDTDETYWEDSRRMATFIYNRVPSARKIPGEPWTTPLKKQYLERRSMDMPKIRPFGIICCVYQNKPIRNKGFHGKSDKKENAKKGVLVGYEDQLGRYTIHKTTPISGLTRTWLPSLTPYCHSTKRTETKWWYNRKRWTENTSTHS